MDYGELAAFILYFLVLIVIGFFIFSRSRGAGEKDYFLGSRAMGPWVTALSAQASDMSGWLLMGFPGSVLAAGFGKVWIAIGLALGSYLTWLFVAAPLRRFSKAAGDAITIPQYLSNRFAAKNPALRVISALIFFVCFTVYVASGFKAGGVLFSSVLGIDSRLAMLIFGLIILVYTFTGGFKAVCWTDFFQGMLMLVAVFLVPTVLFVTNEVSFAPIAQEMPNYFNFLPSGKLDWESVSGILSGLAWGLGYCGMPHILVRYMAIKNSRQIKTSRRIATTWIVITLAAACVIGVLGRALMPELVQSGSEEVFIRMVRMAFPGFVAGILLSAILAAAMSTADSQLLVASSAFTSDLYKPLFRKKASDRELLWVGRAAVAVLSVVAYFIAINPDSGSIMNLVENAWAGFGAAFGPVIVLSLYWRRFTYRGAVAGIVCGGAAVVLWLAFAGATGIYALLPGFLVGLLACFLGSLLSPVPGPEVEKICKEASNLAIDD